MARERTRCPWGGAGTTAMQRYHDEEWGVPRRDDRGQFEFLILESAQAGLSWSCILNKREGYRRCFADFDPVKVAAFGEADVERLVRDAGIVRNRAKIKAAIGNARLFLDLAARHGSFSKFLWSYVDGKPVVNRWETQAEVPATTPLSDRIAADFRRLGFRFMGSTIVYAHLQATGLVNDHLVACFRHAAAARQRRRE